MKRNALPRTRIVVTVAGLLWLAHLGEVVMLGTRPPGPFVSDLIQLTLGLALIYAVISAARRAEGLARSFWRLTALAYALWMVAQILSVYNVLYTSLAIAWITNLLFSFWFVPLGMAIFLDPDKEAGKRRRPGRARLRAGCAGLRRGLSLFFLPTQIGVSE